MFTLEYIDATSSIENFITSIKNTLQYWLSVHTNREAWAQSWNIDDNWQFFLETTPILENNYFSFDLKTACLKEHAKDTLNNMYKCKLCNSIWDAGFEDCDCEGQEYNDNNYEQLTDDDLDYYMEWLENIGIDFSDYIIQNAMETEGFDTYTEALSSTISSTVEDVRNALEMFSNAESNEDLLNTALIVSSILHVNGNILDDYGWNTGLDYETVCKYRNEGITALFSKEEIESFLSQDEMKG